MVHGRPGQKTHDGDRPTARENKMWVHVNGTAQVKTAWKCKAPFEKQCLCLRCRGKGERPVEGRNLTLTLSREILGSEAQRDQILDFSTSLTTIPCCGPRGPSLGPEKRRPHDLRVMAGPHGLSAFKGIASTTRRILGHRDVS